MQTWLLVLCNDSPEQVVALRVENMGEHLKHCIMAIV